ncbi:hypothetical protein Tco_0128809 [Tanacetum coccineum]
MAPRGRPTRLNPDATPTPVADPTTTTLVTSAQLQADGSTRCHCWYWQRRATTQNGDDSHDHSGNRGGTEECRPFDPMFLRGWKPCFRISNCTVENQAEDCQLEAIEMATELMDRRINTFAERQAENKRKFEDTPLITKTNNRTKCKNTGGGLCCGNCEQETDRPHTRQVNFQPRSIPGAAPVARAHLQSDCPIKNKELAYQLQELSDKGFIRPSSSPWGAQFLFVMKEKMDSLRIQDARSVKDWVITPKTPTKIPVPFLSVFAVSSMSDSEDSTVTYTEISSPYEDLSDIGSPGAEGPIFQDPPSPDYVPGPEEPEQAPPSPIYVPFVLEPVYPEFLPENRDTQNEVDRPVAIVIFVDSYVLMWIVEHGRRPDIYTTRIVMKNPNPLNEPNEAIPEENPVIPDPNQVVDVHDPNEMVDIPDDVDLVDYDGDDEENPEEDPEEDPEEEPEPNNGLVNQFALHLDPHQPGVMIGCLEEDDDMNENVNNEDIEDEDVEMEVDDDAELIFPYKVEGDQTPPPRDESSDSEPPNVESSDSVSSDSEGVFEAGEPSSAHDSSYVGGLAPRALRRDQEKKERELLDHDLGDVERTLGNGLERLKVLESGENATLKKRLTKTETKLAWARMEHDIAKGRLHESRVWNKRFYMEMVRIGAVPKPSSDDEGTERPRKKSKKYSFDRAKRPFKPRRPPSDS